jgi:hypothetical protein
MWADNETNVDLLGFDYLVDSLDVLLTQPGLLPLTVGVLGDWGSGKTSLLRMAQERLKPEDGYLTVFFSPWRYEDYEDVKGALIDAILSRLDDAIPEADQERKKQLRALRKMAKFLGAGAAGALKVLVRPAVTVAALHSGASPELAAVTADAAAAAVESATASGESEGTTEATPSVIESVTDFQIEFGRLLAELQQVPETPEQKPLQAVVVFIDDLDRCVPDTIIYVFEAIRLFLQVSSTAFVLAANRDIVQAAIDRRYPAAKDGDPAIGKDYLEKIVQVEVVVPPLSEPESESYLNMLFAQLRLSKVEFGRLRDAAHSRRVAGQFAVAMNHGIATDTLGEAAISEELAKDFDIVLRIAPTLSRGLRGNPRQLKRFLNTLVLRLQTARRRGATLNPEILAKLMVLEIVAPKGFQQLFNWQLAQDGTPDELAAAETAARTSTSLPEDSSNDLQSWFGLEAVQNWLRLDPALNAVGLGQYFFFSRDTLSPSAPAARLSAKLQDLLGELSAEVTFVRRPAVEAAAALPAEEYPQLYSALLERAMRRPESFAMASILELTGRKPASWPTLTEALTGLPKVPTRLPLQLRTVGKNQPTVETLLDRWAQSDDRGLVQAVTTARKAAR